jgi:uncharacterized protein with NAD-binding domain and iron-sulfur cluster
MVDEMMNQYAGDLERRVNERTAALIEAQRRADNLLNQVVVLQQSLIRSPPNQKKTNCFGFGPVNSVNYRTELVFFRKSVDKFF